MTNKRLDTLTAPWFSAWRELLTNQVAIRSSLDFKHGSSILNTELIFMENGVADPGICRMRCKRILGDGVELPATKIETPLLSLETFLTDLREEWFTSKDTSRIADLCLEPQRHVATVVQLYATDRLLLPPSHPLLMLHYGMVYEGIATRHKDRSMYDLPGGALHVSLYGILKRRFGAFLYQQEITSVKNTLGQIP